MRTAQGSYIRAELEPPTSEMVEDADERLERHIGLVADNMLTLADALENAHDTGEFDQRADEHDQSKYGPESRDGYVWNAWWHAHDEDDGVYPDGVQEQVRDVTGDHIEKEPHHPQAHDDIADMSLTDLAEMVADWYAMSVELDEGKEIHAWVEEQKERYSFAPEQEKLIDQMVEILAGANKDGRVAAEWGSGIPQGSYP